MNTLRILIRFGGWRLALSTLAGLMGGAALAALMRMVHQGLSLKPEQLTPALMQCVGLIAIYFVGVMVSGHLLTQSSERLQVQLRHQLMTQVLAAPLRRLEQLGEARLSTILIDGVNALAYFICRLPEDFVNLATAIGCLLYMAWLSPTVLIFNVLFLGVAAVFYLVPLRFSERVSRQAAAAWDRQVGQIQFALRAFRSLLLSSHRRDDFSDRHFAEAGAAVRTLNEKGRFIHLLAERFAEVMVLLNVACLLFVLPRFLPLTTEMISGLLLAAIFLRAPLKDLLAFFPRAQRARIALERMAEAGLEVDRAAPAALAVDASAKPAGFRELTFDRVVFRYENDHDQSGFTTGPLSLRIRAGEVIFIVGGNGAGKTTIGKLLCGLYAPAGGAVTLDGTAIVDEAGRADQRARFSAVFLEDPLFPHVLGVPLAVAENQGNALLEKLKLAHKVALRGTEFSTIDLSQGQRRRLLLLAALVEDRPVLLLDEWASDQDPVFREFFYDALVPYFREMGKTVILITHDDRYFHRADRVLKIDNSHVTESVAHG